MRISIPGVPLCSPFPSSLSHSNDIVCPAFLKGYGFRARCLHESTLYASQINVRDEHLNIWNQTQFSEVAAFDFCLLMQRCFVSITKQVVPVCVVNDESFIPYNDNKPYLFSTYYPARSCSVYFTYIIFF